MPTYPDVITKIVRRDGEKEFKNITRGRLGGSSQSSSIFREEKTGKRWFGKADVVLNKEQTKMYEGRTEAFACKEKIARDIYAYYGANIPRLELSRQKLVNLNVPLVDIIEGSEGFFAIHIMSELLDDFQTYEEGCQEPFSFLKSQTQATLTLTDGRVLPERGLGRILAVASFVNDIDVIGGSGGNMGFQIIRQENGKPCEPYAKTIKIDPGAAFCAEAKAQPEGKKLRVMQMGKVPDLAIEALATSTQQEFFETLHDIVNTRRATIESFFNREGGHAFTVYGNKEQSAERLTALLIERQKVLASIYAKELEFFSQEAKQTPFDQDALTEARDKEARAVQEQLYFYIAPDVLVKEQKETKESQEAKEEKTPLSTTPTTRRPLKAVFEAFLNPQHPARVLLLTGESGAGKSLSLLALEKELLLAQRKKEEKAVKVFRIDLKQFNKDSVKTCIKDALAENYQCTVSDVQQTPVILLLDGYDEIAGQSQDNLYRCQQLDTWPRLKVIISCRSQYLKPGYESWFMPYERNTPRFDLLQIETLAPFSEDQIDAYVKRYTENSNSSLSSQRRYTLEEYRKHLKAIPQLGTLIRNPFMLRILVDALPQFVTHLEKGGQVNRAAIYEAFMQYWFAKQERRLRERKDLPKNWDALKAFQAFDQFSHELALDMHLRNRADIETKENEGNIFWERYFREDHPETVLARSGCPLQRIGAYRYSFVHKSFLEYFTAKALWNLFKAPGQLRAATLLLEAPLTPKALVREQAVIDFLEGLLTTEPDVKKQLFGYIEQSKKNDKMADVSALAITLLNFTGTNLSGKDFQGIRIPNAELGGVLLHNTQLQGADLTHVNLQSAWLRAANFTGANMQGVRLGAFPSFEIGEPIYACAYSPDGKWLAVGAGYGGLYMYETATRKRIKSFEGHTRAVNSIAFSPQGQQLASGSDDKTVRVWDLTSGQEAHCFKGHMDSVKSVAFSPQGQHLASGSWDATVRVWSLASGQEEHCFKGHTGRVWSVAFSPQGQHLASGSDDKTVRVWSLSSGQEERCFKGHMSCSPSVAFSPQGEHLASGCWDNTVRVWSLSSSQEEHCFKGHTGEVHSIAFSPQGEHLASGSIDNTVRVWSLASGQEARCFKGHTSWVRSVAFSPQGQHLASGGDDDKTVRVWSLTSGQEERCFKGHTSYVWSVAFSPQGQQLASGSWDNTVRVWSLMSGQEERCFKGHTIHVYSVAFSPQGEHLASGGWDNTVRVWSLTNSEEARCFKGHTGRVSSVAFSPQGQHLASGGSDNTVRVWSLSSGQEERCFKGHTNVVESVAFSPQGQHLASGSYDNTVRVWSLTSGQEECCFKGHTDYVKSVAFSPQGEHFASGSNDKTVRVWSLSSGQEERCFKGHTNDVKSVAFSPQGQQLASGSGDNTVRVWDITSGKEVFCLSLPQAVNAVEWKSFSKECSLLGVAFGDRVACFELRESPRFEATLQFLAVSGGGTLYASDANLSNIINLDANNHALLQQHGALDSLAPHLEVKEAPSEQKKTPAVQQLNVQNMRTTVLRTSLGSNSHTFFATANESTRTLMENTSEANTSPTRDTRPLSPHVMTSLFSHDNESKETHRLAIKHKKPAELLFEEEPLFQAKKQNNGRTT